MDEPFGSLDAMTKSLLQDALQDIHQRTKTTVVFVTHDIDEAVYLADRIVALGGRPGEVRSSRTIDVARPRRRNALALQEIALDVKAAISAEASAAREDWVI